MVVEHTVQRFIFSAPQSVRLPSVSGSVFIFPSSKSSRFFVDRRRLPQYGGSVFTFGVWATENGSVSERDQYPIDR